MRTAMPRAYQEQLIKTCSGMCRVLVCGCIQELARSTTRDAHLAMKSSLQKSSCASGKKDSPTADGIPSCSIGKTRRKGPKKWCTSHWQGVVGELCSVRHRVWDENQRWAVSKEWRRIKLKPWDFTLVVGITSNQIMLTFILAMGLWMIFAARHRKAFSFRGLIACGVWLVNRMPPSLSMATTLSLNPHVTSLSFMECWLAHVGLSPSRSRWQKPGVRLTYSIYALRMLQTQLHETFSSKWFIQ